MSFLTTIPTYTPNRTLFRLAEMMREVDESRGPISAITEHSSQSDDSCSLNVVHEICVFIRGEIAHGQYKIWEQRFGVVFGDRVTVSNQPPTNNFAIIIVEQHLSFQGRLELAAWLHGYDPAIVVSHRWPIACLEEKALVCTRLYAICTLVTSSFNTHTPTRTDTICKP
jgi:hypothetical protein